MSDRQLPPAAELIRRARLLKGWTQAEAARAASFKSEVNWRQIEGGRSAPAETLARMARVVDVSSDQLKAADQPDAADELQRFTELFGPYESQTNRETPPGSSFEEHERARQERVNELVTKLDDITRELKELQQENGIDRRNSA